MLIGLWCSAEVGKVEHFVLRYPEPVAITQVIVIEMPIYALPCGKVVRIAARLNSVPNLPIQEDSFAAAAVSSSSKKRKRAKVARVKPVGARNSLKKLDPQEWVILWEGKPEQKDYLNRKVKKDVAGKGEEDQEEEDEENEIDVSDSYPKFAPALKVSGVISDTIRIDMDGRPGPAYIEIDTVKLKGISSQTPTPSTNKANGVGAHLLPWVGNDEFADLSIRLDDGSTFPAHKVILAARSDFFKALLTGGMRETGQSEIPIGDLSKEVLQLLMVYLYSGTVECDGDHIIPLFVAADRFTLHDLRAFAVQEFKRYLTVENVLGLLLAVQEFPQLLEACKLFVLGHYKEVALLPAFETLPQHLLLAFIRASLK